LILVTQNAADYIQKILKEEGDNLVLRISVKGGGCSGFKYDFSLVDPTWINLEEYVLVESAGVKVILDTISGQYLEGSTLDFKKRLFSSEFVLYNPKARNTCGCGNSFSA
jgi:iron-sulfur cluster insertion protein